MDRGECAEKVFYEMKAEQLQMVRNISYAFMYKKTSYFTCMKSKTL